MSIVLRLVSLPLAAIAGFLIYAVVHAVTSAGGARPGVAVAYVAAAIVLLVLAAMCWRSATRRSRAADATQARPLT